MAIVRVVAVCPACGASRRFSDLNLDPAGVFITDPESRKVYQLVTKVNELAGRNHCTWHVADMSDTVLQGVIDQLRNALAYTESVRLARSGG